MSQTKTTRVTNPSPQLLKLFNVLRKRQVKAIAQLGKTNSTDALANDGIKLKEVTVEEREKLRITTYKYILS